MGRSRAEHDPATSPARFLRRTRTKTPEQIPGFPSPFGPSADPQPPVAPESATPGPGFAPPVGAEPVPRFTAEPPPGRPAPDTVAPQQTSAPLAADRSSRLFRRGRDAAAAPSATDTPWDWTPSSSGAAPAYSPGAPSPSRVEPGRFVGAPGYGGAVESAQPRAAANQTSNSSAVRTPSAARPPAAAAPSAAAHQNFDAAGYSGTPSAGGIPASAADPARPRTAAPGFGAEAVPPAGAPGFGAGSAAGEFGGRRGGAPGSGKQGRRKRERAAEAVREVLAPTGFEPEELAQRLPDTLRGVGEQALVAVRKWADPRERELRKRRRARRRSFRLGTASGLTTAGTVGLVLISAPAWAVVIVGGGAVALVTGTAVTAKRYLEMRREPLPQATFVPRKLPPIRSAARASIARLVKAERALHGLHTQIARSGRLPEDDLEDTLETAASGAAALHALAQDVVAMERASGALGVNSPLGEHVRAVSIRLDGGVVEFEGMVAAAARVLAVPDSAAVADQLGWAMVNLRDAADRLDGWAQALTDLADQRYRANP